ncbi:MAG: ketoreductase [Methylobacteriaceae bacterium]|nr:ketoreductase [Methylobacteriaceae bacterium]
MSETPAADILSRYSRVAVIGAGVIGASWTAVFLAHGLAVTVNDPRDDVERVVADYIGKAIPTLGELGLPTENLAKKLRFEADLARAVADVDVVQENGPERIEFKQDLWARIGRVVPAHALLLSSSSAKTATEQSLQMENASRLLVGHPFNPPHLIPLVEVVPGERTEPRATEDAVDFYKALGKVPRVLRKEIQGFVANRLQRAIFRECCHLVLQGVVTVDELDDIVTSSIGLRWAADGPFRSFHLGGGPGGFPAFFKQFAPGMEAAWRSQAPVTLDEESQRTIIEQAQASFAANPPEKLEAERDAKQLAILRALASVKEKGVSS